MTLDGAKRLLATTSPDAGGEPKLRLADLEALTRVFYAVLPAEATEDSGLRAGAPFTKAKAAADFPSIVALLLKDAADDDEYAAVQAPVVLLAGGENPAPHGKRVDKVRPLFEDHGEAATAWCDAIRAYAPEASAALLAAAGAMGTHLPSLKANQSAADPAWVSVLPPDDDDLEVVAPEVAKLKAALAQRAAASRASEDDDSAAGAQSQGGGGRTGGVPGVIAAVTPQRDAGSTAATSVTALAGGGATAGRLEN